MESDLIIISEYCEKSHTDPTFIFSLEEDGLIEIRQIDGEQYLLASQLRELERYIHLHDDLSINIEGIDAIRHILGRLELLQQEVYALRRQLHRFRHNDELFTEREKD
ncbi:MAG: chaperone modulator CbpM [Odoribacter sp.]